MTSAGLEIIEKYYYYDYYYQYCVNCIGLSEYCSKWMTKSKVVNLRPVAPTAVNANRPLNVNKYTDNFGYR